MNKRRAALSPNQLAFSFDLPSHTVGEGALAGFDRAIAGAVSQVLKEDPRSRFEIAGGVSGLLDDDVSKAMLDAYSAEAKETHNISLSRFLALIAETQRYDVLDALCQRIGCKVVVGEEIFTVELGHLEAQIQRLQSRKTALKRVAPEIVRERRRK
jgi:hypothetical protein